MEKDELFALSGHDSEFACSNKMPIGSINIDKKNLLCTKVNVVFFDKIRTSNFASAFA
jgi:hypothetical protein